MSDPTIYAQLAAYEKRLKALERQEIAAFVGARVYNNANISILDLTATALTFNSERDDVGDFHSTSVNTGRLTIPIAGTYLVGCTVSFASSAVGLRAANIRLNGTTNIVGDTRPAVTGTVTTIAISTDYTFAAGDYIEVVVFQNSGGALNVEFSGNFSPEFWIRA